MKLMGPGWVLKRLWYALKQRMGWLEHITPKHTWNQVQSPEISGRFFSKRLPPLNDVVQADAILKGQFTWFFHHKFSPGFSPDWFANPFAESTGPFPALSRNHWSRIPDFDHGDIKCIWELSRFAWVYLLIQAYQETGDTKYADTFWLLVTDWAEKNPPNRGVNWKCGQEIAVRLFALTSAWFSFCSSDRSTGTRKHLLRQILYASAVRIEANIGYALSQSNNHGISEAVGLFTAGVLFSIDNWNRKGRRLLESQIHDLVYSDGSFSQHSANYHRVMLHACLWAICIGRSNGIEFSHDFMEKIHLAGRWLLVLADPVSGNMPNLGSNDGALVLPVSQCGYADYRPTIQAAGAVLTGGAWLPRGPWDDLAAWLVPEFHSPVQDERACKTPVEWFPEGGYAVLRLGDAQLVFRCPKHFRHRPAQCDLLHVDLWLNGINIFRDAGTYSYNCPKPWQDYFQSTAAHNTVRFDDHEQMPKISRFLYGKWPRLTVAADLSEEKVEAGFTDWKQCFHSRRIQITTADYTITDTISGFETGAVLRWRLAPELDWRLEGNRCIGVGTDFSVGVSVSGDNLSSRMAEGWESLFYLEKHLVSVLEVTALPGATKIVTDIHIKSAANANS